MGLPPVDPSMVAALHNGGHAGALARVLSSCTPHERAALRDQFLRRAAELLPGGARGVRRCTLAIMSRLLALAPIRDRELIDLGGADGQVLGALIVHGRPAVCSHSTVRRAVRGAFKTPLR